MMCNSRSVRADALAQTRKDLAASISKNNDKAREVVCAVAGSFGFSRFDAESTCLLLRAFGVVRARASLRGPHARGWPNARAFIAFL